MQEHDDIKKPADEGIENDPETTAPESEQAIVEAPAEEVPEASPMPEDTDEADDADAAVSTQEDGTVDEEAPVEAVSELIPDEAQEADEESEEGDSDSADPAAEETGEESPDEEALEESPNASQLSDEELSSIIQVLLLVSDKPLQISRIRNVIEGIDAKKIKELVAVIQQKLADQGFPFQVREVGGGYVLSSLPDYAQWVRKFHAPKLKTSKLSQPALETMAVIAYKQPVTRGEIESIRGVNVDSTVRTLLDKHLVEIVGYKDVVGKPATYGTTNEFLLHFGLNSLSDLPSIDELRRLNAES